MDLDKKTTDLEPQVGEAVFGLSYGQRALWFLDRLAPGNAAYVIAGAARVAGRLDVSALRRAATALAARHPALRATFHDTPEGPVQRVGEEPRVDFVTEEALAGPLAGALAGPELDGRLAEIAFRPFDLARGPLLRLGLVASAEGQVLTVSVHHIVADFWSLGVLLRDLGAIYGRELGLEVSPLPPPPAIGPGEGVRREAASLAGARGEELLAFWRQALAGNPFVLDLPTDHPRPASQGFRGASQSVRLALGPTDALKRLTRRQGATLYMGLLAAFEVLLSRYTGQERLVVGCPTTRRHDPDLAGLVGYLVNPVPIPCALRGDPSGAELLERVRRAALASFAHQDYPLPLLAERLQPERDPGRSPLVQAVLILQKGRKAHEAGLAALAVGEAGVPFALGPLALTSLALDEPGVQFDLQVGLAETARGLAGRWLYDRDLFEPATMERMAGHFTNLLEALAAGGEAGLARPVAALPLLAAGERAQILVEWSGAASPYPRESTVHALFAEQAARAPEAVALVAGGDHLSYGELAARAAHLAGVLAALGVGPEVPVALALPRSPGLVVAILAVLAAGGAYLPLDPAYPEERLAFMLEEGRVPVLLATPELARRLSALARVVLLETDGRLLPGQELPEPQELRGEETGAEGLAYVMFTSGSTGRPKGVAVVHRGVVRLVRGTDYARFGPGEVFLQLAPASFDASTLEIWGALLNGGRLVLMPPETPTLGGLGEALARHGVTTLWLTAGLFHQMVEENLPGLAPVRQLLAGGDALSPVHVARAARELPGTRLINGYGPTEGTTFTCCWPVAAEQLPRLAAAEPVPIGRPIANTRVFVLDREEGLAPLGVPGELMVGGDGLARGYLHRPDLTADSFRPDPFGGAGGRLYRTGDLVRFREAGEIEFLGRIDQQVKIRGFRIEPGEVEAVLAGHPEVGQAAVLVREERGDKRLVAYVAHAADTTAARSGVATDSAGLRSYLKERLPDHMVPGAFVLLEALPLTPNGKVDRRALAAIVPEGEPARYVAPGTPAEALLAGIWAELLGVERVGVEDNFFDLGGHSLLATRVASRVARELGVELPVRALFEAPTVASLAARIAVALPATIPGPVRVARGEGPPWSMPLSFAQERLWFLDRLEPGSAVYNIPGALRLAGRLAVPALAAALTTVVSRYEALRTTFAEADEGAVQEIAPPGPLALPVADLSALPEVEREAEAFSRARAEARRPFDLSRGPLLRVALLRMEDDDHLLVLVVHHIVADGWSLGVLVRELGEVYGALVAGREPHLPHLPILPELPVQYADYAVWQRQWLEGEVLAEQLGWWREKLSGVPTVLDLPADRPRPPVQTQAGGSLAVRLPAELSAGLTALGRAREASPFMVLLAGFAALLSRHTGEERLVVGAPVANRTHREIEDLVGFFVNTLALPVDLGDDPPVAALLAQVRETTLGAYAHQDLPFERLVEELAPERNLAHTPIFQVMLALENTGLTKPSLAGLEVEVVELPSGTEKFDLSLQLGEISGGLSGVLSYSRALFDRTTVERLWAHFLTLLEAAVQEPERRVSELPLLNAGERQQLREWGWASPLPPQESMTIASLFAAQAARTPGAEALVWGERRWTYGELAARAGLLARRLAALGVGPEERVAVCLPRSAGLVVALLGVLEAGGAYVPVDPAYPAERQGLMLADSRAAVVLTSAELLPGMPPGERAIVVLDLATGEPEGPGAEAVPQAAGPGNLAYLIYTSGSTGRPKAVAIAHRSAAGRVRWARGAFTDEELSGVLFATSVCFDLSVFELFVPLSWGGRVILAENALALPRLPAAGEVRLVNTVPSALAELVREGLLPRGVRTVNLAGEPLPRPLAAAIHGTGTVGRLLNLYGPSEDTTYSTGSPVAPGEERAPAIGRPLPGSRAHVVDRFPGGARPVPAGVAGELWLGGAGLARGYFGRPELTAERFLPDPFAESGGERLYRTGDLVRWRPSGELDFLGRIDHQVKVRGFRIELGEIEAALLALPGVREAAVLARDLRLVAYVAGVAGPDEPELSSSRLREGLRARLPEHMLPTSFVLLPALPLSPNGKVDRKALGRIAPEGSAAGSEPVAPRTPTEALLAGIWSELLGVERVGVHDRFFDLGGHSLLATRVVSRVGRELGVVLPVRALFEAPTVAELAELALRLAAARPDAVAGPVRREPGEAPLPLSFAQEQLWFLDRLAPGSAVYNLHAALRLEGRLSAPALAAALTAVTARHEALRTTFVPGAAGPVQVVAPPAPVPLPVCDLAGLPGSAREPAALALSAAEAARPFDLARGPLLRAGLLRLAPEIHLLVLNLHHIVADGWSMGILVREVGEVYGALTVRGTVPALPELPVQYPDFALWQRHQLAGERLAAELAWWRERLAGAPPVLDLPADRPRPAVPSFRGGAVPLVLPASVTEGVARAARELRATPFMVLFAALATVLGRHAGSDDLVLGAVLAQRNRSEVEGLIGFFVNTLPLRADLSGDLTLSELLARSRETALGVYAHQDVPLAWLVEELVPERSLATSPLFQVVLGLQAAPAAPLTLPGLEVTLLPTLHPAAKFDLTFDLAPVGGTLAGAIEYARDLFEEVTVRRLAGHLLTLLDGISRFAAADGGLARPAAELSMLAPGERAQLLAEWGRSAGGERSGPPVHEQFAAWARRTPEAIAVTTGGEVLTYGAAEARANRLARRLREAGVGPEVRVTVSAAGGPARVVGALAVLKAGGAYVPLDPETPEERLAFLLADSRAAVALAEGTLVARLAAAGAPAVLALDDPGDAGTEGEEDAPPHVVLGPRSLAYVIYTSGSTGRPKGVEIPHAGLANLVLWHRAHYGVTAADRATLIANPGFDAAVWETWPYLTTGASLAVPDPAVRLAPGALARWLDEAGITLAFLPTPLAEALLDLLEAGAMPAPAGLRALLVGGDRLHRAPAPGLPFRLVNHYGPSEASVVTTFEPVPPGTGVPAIGRPLDGLRVAVVRRDGGVAPIGVPGELRVAGVGLARGYLGRPDLTAAAFVPDPFSDLPGERSYRTGDLVRWRPDGRLDFLGRTDHQVKVRGFRIELGEIEAALLAVDGVREAAVLAREERPGDLRLVAYVATGDAASAGNTAGLRAALRLRLPAHMVPGAFVFLPALPQSANGKADRKALAALAPEPEPSPAGAAALPSGSVEESLAAIWAEVLGRERVGALDDFFELGGHSLLASRVVSRLATALGVEVPLGALFEHPTVRGLASVISGGIAVSGTAIPTIRPLPPPPRGDELPLSFAQERLWFLDQLEPGSAVYNVPGLVRLRGALRPEVLAAAFHEVARRHEVLRTTFARHGDRPVQVIAAEPRVPLPLVDLAGLPAGRREEEARDLSWAAARLPFDLAAGPLLRVLLLRQGPAEHLALLSLHHIVCDGWSMGVLVGELAALYAAGIAGIAGRPAALPELPWQYADFALWQRELLAGPELARQLDWWRERLAGAPEALALPTDRPRPAVQGFRGGRAAIVLPPALTAAVKRRSQEAGATPFMTLLAVFQVLLARYSGQEDLVVGSPIAGRLRPEVEGLIGFFVNTLVLRLDLGGRPAFRALLVRLRELTLAAYEHQELPFERLVEELRPARQLARSPLFQVMFALQTAPAAALSLPGLELAMAPVEIGVAKFDLILALREADGCLIGAVEYNRDLFDGPTAARLARHFETLLMSAISATGAPERAWTELPLLSPAERHQLFAEWNDLAEDYPREGLVPERIAACAAARPAATALWLDGRRMSYGELRERSERIGRHLRALGVGPDQLVGIAVDRSFEMVAALLGIWAAGGAYVALDPALPAERLAFMVADAGARVVLTQAALAAELPEAGVHRLLVEEIWESEPGLVPAPAPPTLPEQAAYVIYTSGSTGRPKGVLVPHGALGNRLRFAAHLDLGEGVGFLHKTSINFDASITEVFAPLMVGGPVILARPGGEREPGYLAGLLREHRLPAASFTISMLAALLAEGDALAACDGLRVVMSGGEAMPLDLPARLHAQSAAVLLNRYGPTETTISVTSWQCADEERGRTVPIGRPIAGAFIYLLDRDLQPVPVGVPGELCVGGVGLARGYLARPELTAEKFIPHPFGGERGVAGELGLAGERLYRTGDLARFRPDGAIEFVGRTDSQVKIRGFRVELGEIESALARHPGLAEVAVVDREDPGSVSRRLVAYFVPRAARPEPTVREIQQFLAGLLPGYMVPAAFVRLDALPLTPTGKADRKALPEPAADPGSLGEPGEAAWEAPRTPVEELLAGIWAELLGLSRVDRNASFFELGGHSLLATRLLSRLREALGVGLPLRAVFAAPTLAGLADLAEAARRDAHAPGGAAFPAPPPIRPVPRTRDLPLSFAQERLWFLEQLDPGSAAYNLPAAVRFTGRLAVPALAAGLAGIVARHEVLRTRFVAVEGRPVQAIAPGIFRSESGSEWSLPAIDLAGLPAAAREGEARRLARADARQPFDLERGPLVRAALLSLRREEPEEHVLLLCLHHIVTDGWSMGVLVRELGALYAANASDAANPANPASPLPPLPVQYADFAVWQREWLEGEVLAAELAWWRERLAGAPAVLALPTDRPRPAVQRFRGGSVPFALPAEVTAALERLCRRQGVTPFMALLAGLAVLLWRFTGEDDLVVGSPVANRNHREIEGLIGFFVNSLALRVDLSGEPAFATLLARVREQALGAYAHQDLPFEKLVEALAPERSLAHAPLFQVFLVLQNTPAGELRLPDLTLTPLAGETGAAKFDLTLALGANPAGELAGVWEYDRDLFDRSTIVRLGDQLVRLLAAAVAEPEMEIGGLQLLAAPERQQLAEWNATAANYPERTLATLLAEQAARSPDAVAVVFEDESLSYGELAARAGRLAGELRRLGVGPEARVGISAERSLALLVGLAAILQAGGAYVPLDSAYPAERLAFMLEDSGVPVLLTESRLAAALPALPRGTQVVQLDLPLPTPAMPPSEPEIDPEIDLDHLAYVIYTSGSTGRPKGAMNTHRGIVNRLLWMQERYGLTDRDRVLQKTPVSFDVSVWELFWPLLTGACLVVARPGGHQDPGYLVETIVRHEVTFLHFVPAMLSAFLEAPGVEGCAAIRQVVASGEALPYDLERRFFARLGDRLGTRLENLYGPTEAAVDVTFWPCDPGGEASRVPIGRPVANTAIHILGRDLRPLPPGAAGELAIGGVQVARGYLGRPGLTAERFIPDPSPGSPGARLYRTGDLARHLPDGAVEYLGRIDHQVKLRGFRIELGEIEAALLGHPEVRDAVAVVREDPPGGARLVAYLVAEAAAGADLPARLPGSLGESLPSHMVPAAFVVLPALPLTPNGKVDRKALPAPDWRAGASLVAPRTLLEEILAGFFADALGLESVGVEDSFFRLGGHSLLATQLVAKVRGAFQVELPLRRLFESPTVAALAAAVLAAEARPGQSERIAKVLLRVRKLAAEKQMAVAGEEA